MKTSGQKVRRLRRKGMATRPALFKGQARTKRERDKDHDHRRGTAASRGYDSKWSRAADAYRSEHPLCRGCEAVGHVEPAVLVDHVQAHKGDDKLFWRRSNWQPSCLWHHNVVKQRLEHRFDCHQLSAADLRLDSAAAIALTLQYKPDLRGLMASACP